MTVPFVSGTPHSTSNVMKPPRLDRRVGQRGSHAGNDDEAGLRFDRAVQHGELHQHVANAAQRALHDVLVEHARARHLDHEGWLARIDACTGEGQRIRRGRDDRESERVRHREAALPCRRALGILLAAAIHEGERHARVAHGVQVDRGVATLHDLAPQRVRDPLREATPGVARPELVQVAAECDAFSRRVVRAQCASRTGGRAGWRRARRRLRPDRAGERHVAHRWRSASTAYIVSWPCEPACT